MSRCASSSFRHPGLGSPHGRGLLVIPYGWQLLPQFAPCDALASFMIARVCTATTYAQVKRFRSSKVSTKSEFQIMLLSLIPTWSYV